MKSILDYEIVDYDSKKKALVIIDQTKLPNDIELLSLRGAEDIWNAIYELKVRGVPATGVAAAIGLAVLAEQIEAQDRAAFMEALENHKAYLVSSRPTAVNLSWALNRMMQVCYGHAGSTVEELKEMLLQEALQHMREDIEVCRKIGQYGLTLL